MAKMKAKQFRTLFFIAGPCATEEEEIAASAIEGSVFFRNVIYARQDTSIEDFDGVAGIVPPHYAAAAEAKAALGEGEPAPEPKAALPAPGGVLTGTGAPKAPTAGRAGGGWKPNA